MLAKSNEQQTRMKILYYQNDINYSKQLNVILDRIINFFYSIELLQCIVIYFD